MYSVHRIKPSAGQLLAVMFLLIVVDTFVIADVIDQFARQGKALIASAAIQGVKIRQCTCTEQSQCLQEMDAQATGCVDKCWNKFSRITKKPDDLRKCFARTDNLIDDFIRCFEHNVDACLHERADTQIQKVNITELFRLSVERIQKTKDQLAKNLVKSIREVVETATDFGLCVKDCFIKMNKNGFCFDKAECQPLVLDKKARISLRQCIRIIDWKKEAGDLCECSVAAGIGELKQYCPMLRLIGGKQNRLPDRLPIAVLMNTTNSGA